MDFGAELVDRFEKHFGPVATKILLGTLGVTAASSLFTLLVNQLLGLSLTLMGPTDASRNVLIRLGNATVYVMVIAMSVMILILAIGIFRARRDLDSTRKKRDEDLAGAVAKRARAEEGVRVAVASLVHQLGRLEAELVNLPQQDAAELRRFTDRLRRDMPDIGMYVKKAKPGWPPKPGEM